VADDLATQDVVLFGGVDDFGSTWLWTGTRWELTHPAVSPPGRYGAAAAYDPETDQVLLFGGRLEPGTPVNDTWGWDGRNWQALNDGAGGPPPGDGGVMAWDPVRDPMLLVTRPPATTGSGETWIWSGSAWQRRPAGDIGTNDSGLVMAYDPVSGSLLAEGCCQTPSGSAGAERYATWRWDGSRWHELLPQLSPPNSTGLAIDPSRDQLVLCSCGLVGGLVPAMWAWTGTQWVAMDTGRVPPQPETELDEVDRSELLVLGFAIAAGGSIAQPIEVWALSGATWTRVDTGAS
jgi:hypothetical protein